MKKEFLAITLMTIGFIQNSFSQNTTKTTQLLPLYYGIKDALVVDNSVLASAKATEFVKEFSVSDQNKLSQTDRDALLKDATHISESKDIKHQREHFVALSNTLVTLAKASKLSAQPVYLMYCPMKKSSWLSNEKGIKNPYYGKSMLTCGTVTQTL